MQRIAWVCWFISFPNSKLFVAADGMKKVEVRGGVRREDPVLF